VVEKTRKESARRKAKTSLEKPDEIALLENGMLGFSLETFLEAR